MLIDHIRPYMGELTDNQQRVIRWLYEKRYTRPYAAAMMGCALHQVMTEELNALRAVIQTALPIEGEDKAKPGRKKKSPAAAAIGSKQSRSAAGPSSLDP